jgi:hypothetical protein
MVKINFILVLALLLIAGCASKLERGEDGFYHFKSGEKFMHQRTKNNWNGWLGDLFLESGDVYHSVSVYNDPEYPDLTYEQHSEIGITLSNNIRLMTHGFDGYHAEIKGAEVLFPNGWMIKPAAHVATHFSKLEDKFMFGGEVKFGILVLTNEGNWSEKNYSDKKQAMAFLGELFPGKPIH